VTNTTVSPELQPATNLSESDGFYCPGYRRLNSLRYFSALSGQRAPRLDDLLGNTPSRRVGDLLLGLLRKVRMIPQVFEVLGKLTVHPYPTSGLTTVSVGKRQKSRSEVHNSRTP
jgi:hypothetical protein